MNSLLTWPQVWTAVVVTPMALLTARHVYEWLFPRAGSVWDDRRAVRWTRQIAQAKQQWMLAAADGDIEAYARWTARYKQLGGV